MLHFAKPNGSTINPSYSGVKCVFNYRGVKVAETHGQPMVAEDWDIILSVTDGEKEEMRKSIVMAWASLLECENIISIPKGLN